MSHSGEAAHCVANAGDSESRGVLRIRLYYDLADWYPLLMPIGDHAEEAFTYWRAADGRRRGRMT